MFFPRLDGATLPFNRNCLLLLDQLEVRTFNMLDYELSQSRYLLDTSLTGAFQAPNASLHMEGVHSASWHERRMVTQPGENHVLGSEFLLRKRLSYLSSLFQV